MSAFLAEAGQILETAREGAGDCRLSILVGREGDLRMFAASDWELEPLRIHHGARAAYRITRRGNSVQIEGRADEGTCRLQAGVRCMPGILSPDLPQYHLA